MTRKIKQAVGKILLSPFTKGGILTFLFSTFFACQLLLANTNYVGTSGTPGGTYFTDIQSAVDATIENGLVLVSNGVYNSGERVTPYNSASNRILILTNITVRSINGPQSTIIVGTPGIDGACGTGAVRCVMMEAGTLSGFTLSNGFALNYGNTDPDMVGGGVFIIASSLVTNCVITSCKALGDGGGGACINYSGTIIDSKILNNEAWFGGGVFLSYGGMVKNSKIIKNKGEMGGGFRMHAGEASDCIITGNYSSWNGGGIDGYDCLVRNCLIANNSTDMSSGDGGGIHCFMNMYIVDCSIISNSAEDGGGINCYVSPGYKGSIISNCVISGNFASDWGGGVYFGSDSELLNCLLNDNFSSNRGGGICFYNGGIIKNCTVVSNSVVNDGGGVYCISGGSNLNSIIYFNSAVEGTNYYNNGTEMVYEYSCSYPLPTGAGNISTDPKFVSSISNNWRLQPTSPCINAGTNAYAAIPWDLDGNPRIVGGRVDMGAYELVPEPFLFINCYLLFIIYYRRKLK